MTSTVIFACEHNAGRSQMAAAFFNALADPTRARAVAAGTQPGDRVHPEVVATMREVGIGLSDAQPRRLTEALTAEAQLLITMGCGKSCPVLPGVRRDDWNLADPKARTPEEVRAIRATSAIASRASCRRGGGRSSDGGACRTTSCFDVSRDGRVRYARPSESRVALSCARCAAA